MLVYRDSLDNSRRLLMHKIGRLVEQSGSHKTDLAVISDKSRKPLRAPEMVEVSDCLAHREKALLQVELAAEEHRNEFGCRVWLVRRRYQLGQPRIMVRAQLLDTGTGADKRQTVRRENERIRREVGEGRKRIEKARQRIAVGLDRPDADIGADSGQQHVAGNADVDRFAIE